MKKACDLLLWYIARSAFSAGYIKHDVCQLLLNKHHSLWNTRFTLVHLIIILPIKFSINWSQVLAVLLYTNTITTTTKNQTAHGLKKKGNWKDLNSLSLLFVLAEESVRLSTSKTSILRRTSTHETIPFSMC